MARDSSERWAVLIGINGYHEGLGPLHYCVNDAKLMQQTLISETCGFRSENTLLLCDDEPRDRQPTYVNIHSWLRTWLSRPAQDDLVLVYFAGHGREVGASAMLAPVDATLDSLAVTGIPIQYVRDLLDRCAASQKVLILDTCHSGGGRDVAAMTNRFRADLERGRGLYTIASCDHSQISYEWPEKQHGVFTYYLTEAISEAAPVDLDGIVTLDAVYGWTRRRVLDWSKDRRLSQDPVRLCNVRGRIPIAVRKLTQAVDLLPDAAADLAAAQSLLESGKLLDARAAAEAGLKKEPLSYDLRKLSRDIEEALLRAQEEQKEADRKKVEAHVAKLMRNAARYEKEGDLPSAVACLEEAAKYEPDGEPGAQLERIQLREKVGGLSKASQLKLLFARADEVEASDPEAGLTLFQEALKIYPGNRRAKEGIEQCQRRLEVGSLRERVERALQSVKARAKNLSAAISQLQADCQEYDDLAMDAELQQTRQELKEQQEQRSRTARVAPFLTGALRALSGATSVEEARDAILGDKRTLVAARDVVLNELECDQELLAATVPSLVKAKKKLDQWVARASEELKAACEKRSSLMQEYKARVKADKETVKAENARLQAEYKKAVENEKRRVKRENERRRREFEQLSWLAKLFKDAPPPAEKKRIPHPVRAHPIVIPEPDLTKLVSWPRFPVACIRAFGERCLDVLPHPAPEWAGLALFATRLRRRIRSTSQEAAGARSAPQDKREEAPTSGSQARKTPRRRPRPARPSVESFQDWISDKQGVDAFGLEWIWESMTASIKGLLEAGQEARINGLGRFVLDERGRIQLNFAPKTKSTSRTLRDALLTEQALSREDVGDCIRVWGAIPEYCRSVQGKVVIKRFGQFSHDDKGQVTFKPARSLSAIGKPATRRKRRGR